MNGKWCRPASMRKRSWLPLIHRCCIVWWYRKPLEIIIIRFGPKVSWFMLFIPHLYIILRWGTQKNNLFLRRCLRCCVKIDLSLESASSSTTISNFISWPKGISFGSYDFIKLPFWSSYNEIWFFHCGTSFLKHHRGLLIVILIKWQCTCICQNHFIATNI